MKSDAIIDRLGWKPLSGRRDEHIKELFNKCLKDKEHVPDLFKNYFNTRRIDILSYFIRSSGTNLFIDRSFYYKGELFFTLSFRV